MAVHAHATHREHTAEANRRRLVFVLLLTAGYTIAEVAGGLLTNSLALLSDAGHMLTDIGALGMALFALWFAQRPATPRKTFGYYRIEILAALVNGMVLLALSVFIIVQAIIRLRQPPEVGGLGLLVVALGGLLINCVGAYALHHGHTHSLNVRAAFYHILGDTLGSLGAIAAGVCIFFFHWQRADPLLAIGISLLIIVSAVALVREATDVLLEATPNHLDTDTVRTAILRVAGVENVHDLHIWTITTGLYALSCHVVVHPDAFTVAKLDELRVLLHDCCDIPHQTIQLETHELADEEEIHL